MREHGPEPAQRVGRDARPERRDVTFQVGADEALAPDRAVGVGRGENAARESASNPQPHLVALRQLADVQRTEIQVRDAAGEALSRLPQEIHRGRAEQQELPRGLTAADALVDDSAQGLKQLGGTVDFVQHHQAVVFRGEIAARVRQLFPVDGILQVEVQALPKGAPLARIVRLREGSRQRRLADLARSQEGHGREQPQAFLQAYAQESWDCVAEHLCTYGNQNQICKSTQNHRRFDHPRSERAANQTGDDTAALIGTMDAMHQSAEFRSRVATIRHLAAYCRNLNIR